MASSSSSSSFRQMKYQVFLSFRGEDTRHTFTAQLHKTLKDTGINVFFDEDKLEKGKQLSPELSQAIAESTISIIILSKDYASSKSCLNELSDIMDHKDRQGQIVLPIFYHVDPSDVRNLGGSFKTSFEEHESKIPFDEVKVNQWKSAFADVGTLKGWHINGDRSETEYIEDVAKTVIESLNSKSRSVLKGLVGIDDQKNTILRLIEEEENRVIGLWGMGGCGKTTLAEAVYNEISSDFDAHWFVQNVREKCEKDGLESVRNDLVSKLLNARTCIDTPSIGSTLIQQRLNNKRVIVVLDDVSYSDQILGMGIEHFGRGSKIIVTSRVKQELENGGADKIHKVEMLSEMDSLGLFSTHAFKQLNPAVEFLNLCYKFLKYAQGSPLALKVLGSLLYAKPRQVWESEVVKLNEYAKPKISEVLKRSFYVLGELEKKIFLDIAIFFKGKRKEEVEAYLRGCYNESAVSGISRLLDKCLIEIVTIYMFGEHYEAISMHDMLEEMGKFIELKDSGNRKRLWSAEDGKKMLRYNKWADSVEGIRLDVSDFYNQWLRSNVFQNMHSLRLIYLYGYITYGEKQHEIQVDIVYLPDEIKYLHWEDYPFKSLPSSFNPTNLIVLRLSGWHMEQLWNEDHEDLVNLREIDVSGCTDLKKIPNLSRAINLKLLKCEFCESLVEFASLDHLASLEEVNLNGCESLKKISNLSGALNLKKINCFGCSRLVELPCFDHLASLEEVNLSYSTSLRKISNLSGTINLKSIKCFECSSLVELPYLSSFKELDECFNLKKFPEVPNHFCKLDLSESQIEQVPDSVEHLVRLKSLDMSHSLDLSFCPVTEFPEVPRNLTESHLRFKGLQVLRIRDCEGLKLLSELPPYLRHLDSRNCRSLEKVSFTYQNLYQLDSLDDDDDEFVMLFNNCWKLNKDSVDNIETVALLKIGSLAQKWIREYGDFRKNKNFICCIPGNMISENKFEGRSESSSLILKLAPKPNGCSGGRFLAFAICLVADLVNLKQDTPFTCNYQLTSAGGRKFKSECQVDIEMRRDFVKGDHVFILFSQDMIQIDKDYEEASFQFYIKYPRSIVEWTGDKYNKVKKCGIHVFYVDGGMWNSCI